MPVVAEPAARRAASPAAGAGSTAVGHAGRRRAGARRTASCSRAAALPVGAASAIRGGGPGRSRQQREELRDGGGLARARTAREDRDRAERRHRRGEPLAVSRGSPSSPNSRASPARSRSRSTDGGSAGARGQLRADHLLLPPVPLQVEQAVDEPERTPARRVRPVGDERARRARRDPAPGLGPRQRRRRRRARHPRRAPCPAPRRGRRRPSPAAPPRTASATASSTSSADSPPSRRDAGRDVHVGGLQHAGRVERRQQAGRGARHARVVRVVEQDPAGHARSPIEQVRQLRHQRRGRLPGEDTAGHAVDHRGVRPAHAAQEQVQHPAEVPVRVVVAGQPPAQEPVQRHGVEQRLERVVRVEHRRGEPFAGCSARRPAAPGRPARSGRASSSCSRRRRTGGPAGAGRRRCCR